MLCITIHENTLHYTTLHGVNTQKTVVQQHFGHLVVKSCP